MDNTPTYFVHESSYVDQPCVIGEGSKIWHFSHIMRDCTLGQRCNIGQNVVISPGCRIGANVKIQNNVSIFHGVTVEDGVFIGPHVCFCNDMLPRAITPTGALKGQEDWEVGKVLVRAGASIGAGSIILPDVTIGSFALIGSGSVVTRSVPDQALVYGNPARLQSYVCRCARKLEHLTQTPAGLTGICPVCQTSYTLPAGENR